MSGGLIPPGYVEVDFEIIRERWNDYRLPHGVRLRARAILVRLLWPPGAQPSAEDAVLNLGIATSNILVVTAPPDQCGPPSPPLPGDELAVAKRQLLQPIEAREYWNFYRLADGRGFLKVKANLTKAERLVGRYDGAGAPLVSIGTAIIGSKASKDEVDAEIAELG